MTRAVDYSCQSTQNVVDWVSSRPSISPQPIPPPPCSRESSSRHNLLAPQCSSPPRFGRYPRRPLSLSPKLRSWQGISGDVPDCHSLSFLSAHGWSIQIAQLCQGARLPAELIQEIERPCLGTREHDNIGFLAERCFESGSLTRMIW